MATVGGSAGGFALLVEPIIDTALDAQRGGVAEIWRVAAAVLALGILGGAAAFGQALLMGHAGFDIVADIQKRLYRHLVHADLALFARHPSGQIVARFVHDIFQLRDAATKTLTVMAKDSVTVAALLAVMVYQDWRLAGLLCLVVPLLAWPVARLGRRMRRIAGQEQQEYGNLTARLDEVFRGLRIVKAFGREAREAERMAGVTEMVRRRVMKIEITRAGAHPIVETLSGICIAGVVLYGGSSVLAGNRSEGAFLSLLAAALMAYRPLKNVATLRVAVEQGLSAAARVFALLDEPPKVTEAPGAPDLAVGKGRIGFESVFYRYDDGPPVLTDISLSIESGETVALVGPSGAGKSTMLNLIPRFFDVTAGRVLIDGQDTRSVTLSSLRRNIALVSQDAMLFDASIGANIAYGRPGADHEAIVAAARDARAHEFIRALPDGYDTRVGTDGFALSGGQRQRIVIARAIIKDAPILLLDEATAALDPETEAEVQTVLRRLMTGRTTVLIAHRLATVRDADRICVLEAGRLVETGSHAALLAANGIYAKLYENQFGAAA